MKNYIKVFNWFSVVFIVFLGTTIHAQTFNYGTGLVSSNAAPFAVGDANVQVVGNDVTVVGNTNMTAGTYNFANFTINAGVTVTVTGNTAPLIIRCTGNFTNNGDLRAVSGNGGNASGATAGSAGLAVAGGVNGGAGGAGGNGASGNTAPGVNFGSSSGRGLQGCGVSNTRPSWAGPGGGGGAYGSVGTNGGNGSGQSTGCATGGVTGSVYGNADLTAQVGASGVYFSAGQTSAGDRWILGGSSGAGGHGTQSFLASARAAGGGGGASGGAIQIVANSVSIGPGAWVRCRGGNGGNGSVSTGGNAGGGGGGAGSGGTINIQYMSSYSNNGTIQVSGGIGGSQGFGTTGTGGAGGNGGVGRTLVEQDEVLCTPPSGSATAFSATGVTTNSATLNWTRGNGDEVLVIVREGAAVSGGPVSANSYSANSDFTLGQALGGGRVVYIGSGTTVNVTNLPNLNTTYHVSVFEFFTADGGCYQLAGEQLTGTFTTANGAMTYVSSTNVQQTGSSPLGSTNQEILRLEVVGGPGTSPALTMNSITFNTTGTTNTSDLTGARIFYTGNSNTFATTTPFGSTVNNPSGTHVVNGNQDLLTGTNYFWLVYDVSIGATVGNVMDAQITSINVGNDEVPTETNPGGNRVITSLMNLSCGYSFQHFTPTWTSNVGQSGTTVIASGAASIDDQRWPGQSFATDFSFEYNGTVYTNFGIHSKGFIWFGNTTPSGLLATPISSVSAYEGAIAPFAFDMVAHSASTTTPQVTVRYTGTAPNRVCIIEWTAMRPYNNTGGVCSAFGSPTDWNRYDFQLHLHENGGTNANRIEFVYRDMNPFCVNGNGASAQVGLRGPNNSDFLNRQGSGNNAHTASSSGAANTSTISHGASNYFNGNGGMRFTPTFQIPQVSPLPTAENSCPNETVELSTTSPVAIKQWYNNNLPISGANGSDYDASESGNHLLVVSQGGCSKVSDVIDVTITPCNVCETVFGIDKIESCEPIIWIDGNLYSSNNYTATHLLEGASQDGCDSLVTLNLTIWNCIQLEVGSCGATDVQMDQVLSAVFVQNHNGYRFRITGANNGGTGWNGNTFILDRPVRNFRFSHVPGAIWGETYTVEVALGDGMGEYGPYGNACNVTLVNLPATTQLQNSQCGISNVSQTTYLFANQVSNVAGYRFRIVGANNGAQGWTGNTFILDRPSRDFRFSMVPGVIWGQTYSVEVAVLSYDNLTYSPYGTACNITLQGTPTTALQASQCGIMNVAQNTALFANTVSGAAGYRFRVVGANNGSQGWVIDTYILDRPVRNFKFNMIPGVLQGEEYQVQVAVMDANGIYGAYGSVCTITLEGTPDFVINDENEIFFNDKAMNVVEFGASASHNPFTTDFGIQVLNANDSETINVVIYDMSGKLIASKSVNPLDIENARFGQNLASGMYMIEVRQGSNQAVIRQVKN